MNDAVAKIRDDLDDLLDWIGGRGNIVIIVHDNPDPDCLASAMALRHLFVMKLNRDATITFSGMIGRSENLAMARVLEIPLTPLGIINLNEYQVICMLDTQPETGNNSLPPGTKVDIIIDHHPLREKSRGCRWVDVREDYGATATIIYEYLQVMDVHIGIKMATAIFYAIKSETQDLGREAGLPDKEAYLRLFPMTGKKLLFEITHPKLPVEYFLTIENALENTRIYDRALFVDLGKVFFPELVAEMADFLLRLENIETILCMGHYGTEIILSLRTERNDLNAGDVIKQVVAGIGKAGGHGMMAGGKIDGVGNSRKAVREMVSTLKERFLLELGIGKTRPRRLLR
jgi:nanoRNase/pAp phosphatase (c-di-AMP/oligoRNAs hydrolase)